MDLVLIASLIHFNTSVLLFIGLGSHPQIRFNYFITFRKFRFQFFIINTNSNGFDTTFLKFCFETCYFSEFGGAYWCLVCGVWEKHNPAISSPVVGSLSCHNHPVFRSISDFLIFITFSFPGNEYILYSMFAIINFIANAVLSNSSYTPFFGSCLLCLCLGVDFLGIIKHGKDDCGFSAAG